MASGPPFAQGASIHEEVSMRGIRSAAVRTGIAGGASFFLHAPIPNSRAYPLMWTALAGGVAFWTRRSCRRCCRCGCDRRRADDTGQACALAAWQCASGLAIVAAEFYRYLSMET
jgi:hypothetical protein